MYKDIIAFQYYIVSDFSVFQLYGKLFLRLLTFVSQINLNIFFSNVSIYRNSLHISEIIPCLGYVFKCCFLVCHCFWFFLYLFMQGRYFFYFYICQSFNICLLIYVILNRSSPFEVIGIPILLPATSEVYLFNTQILICLEFIHSF